MEGVDAESEASHDNLCKLIDDFKLVIAAVDQQAYVDHLPKIRADPGMLSITYGSFCIPFLHFRFAFLHYFKGH